MAHIDPDLQRRYRFLSGMIPPDVRRAIDEREVRDRIVQADSLIRKSEQAPTVAERKRLGDRAERILSARPRSATEAIVAGKIRKAKAIGDPGMARALEQQARDELVAHPPAIRQSSPAAAVLKASADGQLFACFEQDGTLCGVADPDDIEVVDAGGIEGDGGGDDGGAAGQMLSSVLPGAQVAKSSDGVGKRKAVFDSQHQLVGVIDPAKIQPVITDAAEVRSAAGAAPRPAVAKGAPPGHEPHFDAAGTFRGYVKSEHVVGDPDAQAADSGPVDAGGTTGLGQPRVTGPAGSLPADGPQAARPGDAAGRQVVKSAADRRLHAEQSQRITRAFADSWRASRRRQGRSPRGR